MEGEVVYDFYLNELKTIIARHYDTSSHMYAYVPLKYISPEFKDLIAMYKLEGMENPPDDKHGTYRTGRFLTYAEYA